MDRPSQNSLRVSRSEAKTCIVFHPRAWKTRLELALRQAILSIILAVFAPLSLLPASASQLGMLTPGPRGSTAQMTTLSTTVILLAWMPTHTSNIKSITQSKRATRPSGMLTVPPPAQPAANLSGSPKLAGRCLAQPQARQCPALQTRNPIGIKWDVLHSANQHVVVYIARCGPYYPFPGIRHCRFYFEYHTPLRPFLLGVKHGTLEY